MMKNTKWTKWLMMPMAALTIVCMSACNQNSEQEDPTVCPKVEPVQLYVTGVPTRGTGNSVDTIFTDDDIAWFNPKTREIKFKNLKEPLYKRCQSFKALDFHLGDNQLFTVTNFLASLSSIIYQDLVLVEDLDSDKYYINDSYPSYIEDEIVKENRKKNANQWNAFITYLESKGKIITE